MVDCIAYRKNSELSYYFLILHDNELGALSKAKLVQVIVEDKTRGSEFAFRLLRDQQTFDREFREALLGKIVASADKTTCSLTLQCVPDLGDWEGRLKDVLSG